MGPEGPQQSQIHAALAESMEISGNISFFLTLSYILQPREENQKCKQSDESRKGEGDRGPTEKGVVSRREVE